MAKSDRREIVSALLDEYGRTYAQEVAIDVEKGTPSGLFQLLIASMLFAKRIRAETAVAAAKALFEKGWTTPEKMARSTWRERTDTLNRSGYARYDESTSRYIGETTDLLLDRWDGDLRMLREEAGRKPDEERGLLKEFKGVGDVAVDIFFREVQVAWEEVWPFADARALKSAKQLDLGEDADTLAGLVDRRDFATLVAALVRVDIGGHHDELMQHAA